MPEGRYKKRVGMPLFFPGATTPILRAVPAQTLAIPALRQRVLTDFFTGRSAEANALEEAEVAYLGERSLPYFERLEGERLRFVYTRGCTEDDDEQDDAHHPLPPSSSPPSSPARRAGTSDDDEDLDTANDALNQTWAEVNELLASYRANFAEAKKRTAQYAEINERAQKRRRTDY
ncbi:hypothetical protein K438DRAFT_1768532 [Mycena galopus ATCC 62051]|nr:hypothetical protein K438DRAFT_1768532 [Mycena galopus ATCC 62051]